MKKRNFSILPTFDTSYDTWNFKKFPIFLIDLIAYEIQVTKKQSWSMQTYFYGLCGPFRDNLAFWQKAVLAIFKQKIPF